MPAVAKMLRLGMSGRERTWLRMQLQERPRDAEIERDAGTQAGRERLGWRLEQTTVIWNGWRGERRGEAGSGWVAVAVLCRRPVRIRASLRARPSAANEPRLRGACAVPARRLRGEVGGVPWCRTSTIHA